MPRIMQLLCSALLCALCACQSPFPSQGAGAAAQAPESPTQSAQQPLRFNRGAELSEDERDADALKPSLLAFLAEADAGEFTEATVPPGELLRHAFFFKGLKAFSSRSNETWDPPTLLKSYSFDGETYFVTVAFTGAREGAPFLHKIVELKAVPYGDAFRFTSPFEERTARLAASTFGNVTFHHGAPMDEALARRFVRFREEFSELTDTPNLPLDYYCFESLDELLISFGFVFDCTKCNFLAHDLGFFSSNGQRFFTGAGNPNYVFEYVDGYVSQSLPNSGDLYSPFVIGMAVCYGGYALTGSGLPELKAEFREALAKAPDMDFLEEFHKGRRASVNRHFSFYVMSAFLCELALKDGGFEAARRLLYSGPKGERFFENLDEVLGVNESNFHGTIARLISTK